MKVIFVTSNREKVIVLQKALYSFGIEVFQKKIKIPEIQDLDVLKIAEFSAKYAAEKLKKPVIVTDAGLYIKSLNGFPGPMLKFLNVWFTPDDIIKLMKGKKDRSAIAKDCLAYCKPGKKPVSFTNEIKCEIAQKSQGKGTTTDRLLVWSGINKVRGVVPDEVMIEYWFKRIGIYNKFGKYLRSKT